MDVNSRAQNTYKMHAHIHGEGPKIRLLSPVRWYRQRKGWLEIPAGTEAVLMNEQWERIDCQHDWQDGRAWNSRVYFPEHRELLKVPRTAFEILVGVK